jgi:hypothetical protein
MYPVPKTRSGKTVMLVCFSMLLHFQFVKAQCIASGPNSPGIATNNSYTGSDYTFADPLYSLSSNNNRAVASTALSLLGGQTAHLQATDFGFSIPIAATICGIEVHIEKSATDLLLGFTSVKDDSVCIIKGGIRITGTNLSQNIQWSEDNDAISNYGHNTELWGTSWTPTDINSSNFGVAISAQVQGIVGLRPEVRVDYISITVYYLEPTTLPAQSIQFDVANGIKNTAVLSWKPTDMEEAASYKVERSVNGTKWEALNGTPQKSTISPLLTFTDDQPLPGKSFYRLKKMGVSGEIRYSTVLPFEAINITSLKCYPNPFTSFIKVTGALAGEQVAITDIYGKRLYLSSPAINNIIKIDVSHLQPGMYVISTGKKKIKIQKK